MRIPRIYCDTALETGAVVELPATQSHYLAKVLRMTEGRPLVLFNGKGGEYEATIATVTKKSISVAVGDFFSVDRASSLNIHLGIGMSKGDRMEQVIQKATELGVTQITPLFSERSEVKLKGERLHKKTEHWQQIAFSACEQCQLNLPPLVQSPALLADWLPSVNEQTKLVLHHRSTFHFDTDAQVSSACLLIGPEGGLSEEEIADAVDNGFKELCLGPRVLRTETAPLAAISLLQHYWGDW